MPIRIADLVTVLILISGHPGSVLAQGPPDDQPAVPRLNLPTANSQKATTTPETSVSLGANAQLTASRINISNTNLLTESLNPSAGVFGTFRQTFRPWLGYSVNLGYSQSTYRYTNSAPVSMQAYTTRTLVPAHRYEISVSYTAQKRFTKRFSLFGEAGAGTIAFAAINNGLGLPTRANAFKPAGIFGGGADYRLSHGFGMRAQYRGLLLSFPYPNDGVGTKLRTIINEPTLSLTYTFGSHGHR